MFVSVIFSLFYICMNFPKSDRKSTIKYVFFALSAPQAKKTLFYACKLFFLTFFDVSKRFCKKYQNCICMILGISKNICMNSYIYMIPDMKLATRLWRWERGTPPAERSILGPPFSELREPMKKSWKSGREKSLKLFTKKNVGFFGCYWGCYWCWSREDITKIDIVHSTVLRAAMTDFIFPKADNISRMSSELSVFFEGF